MDINTEAGVQRIINLEIILIIVALGVDIFIQAISVHDWVATAIIIIGFGIVSVLYWHTLHIDRLFKDLHLGLAHLLHPTPYPIPPSPAIPLPAAVQTIQKSSPNIPLSAVADRPILHVSNFLLSKNFYAQVLATLGYALTIEFPALSMAAFGIGTASDIWIKGDGVGQKIRAAFAASSKAMVDSFYEVALNGGGTEAEAPGERPARGTGYYAAAVYDPDGYTIEAVFCDDGAVDADMIDDIG